MLRYWIQSSCSFPVYPLNQTLLLLRNSSPTGFPSLILPVWYLLFSFLCWQINYYMFFFSKPKAVYVHLCVCNLQVKSLIDDTKSSSTPVSISKNCANLNIACGSALPSVFLNSGTPPLSPRGSSSGSPRFSRQKTSPFSLHSPLRSLREPPKPQLIPQVCCLHLLKYMDVLAS